jgi:hypothetical protein
MLSDPTLYRADGSPVRLSEVATSLTFVVMLRHLA